MLEAECSVPEYASQTWVPRSRDDDSILVAPWGDAVVTRKDMRTLLCPRKADSRTGSTLLDHNDVKLAEKSP